MLEKQLQMQTKTQNKPSAYNMLPADIRSVLDDIAFGLSIKENKPVMELKNNLVNSLNKLNIEELNYLVEHLNELIYRSVQKNETIDQNNTDANFISFLTRLYFDT